MTRQEHIKRARYRSPRDWTQEAIDAYHKRMQELQAERAKERRARQREILRGLKEEEESE